MSLSTYNQRYASTDSQTAGAFAFDTISGSDYAISKLAFGTLGSVTIVDASNPLPVTISGVATAANQSTANTSLSSIDGKLPALGQALAGASVPVVLTAAQIATLTPLSSVAATQSGTWNITNVSGTISLPTGAATAAKQPALGTAGTASADVITVQGISSMTPLKVDGSAVTQPVSIASTLTVTGSGGTFPVTDSGGSLTVDAPVGTPVFVRLSDGSSAISTLAVSLASVPSHAVTNAGTFAVQESGTHVQVDDAAFTPATSKIVMAGAEFDDSSPDSVDEGDGGALRMSGNRNLYVRIRDNAGNERGLNIDSNGELQISGSRNAVAITDNSGSLTVDNGGTFAVQATVAAAATNIAKAEDVASADADVGVPAMAIRKATPGNTSGTDGDYEMLQVSAGRLWASVIVDTALPAGTNAIGKLAANSGVTIGAVEIASAQTLATVTTVSTVTTCSTVTTVSTLTGGGVAHDGSDSGNPHKVGARCALTLSDDTIVANSDRTDNVSDGDGTLLVRNQFPLADLVSERVTDTAGTSAAFTNFGATANTRNVITAIVVYNSSATAGFVDFRDGTAGSVLFTVPIPAGGGAVLPAGATPYFKTTANTALAYDVSAGLSTVYISISGFRSKVV